MHEGTSRFLRRRAVPGDTRTTLSIAARFLSSSQLRRSHRPAIFASLSHVRAAVCRCVTSAHASDALPRSTRTVGGIRWRGAHRGGGARARGRHSSWRRPDRLGGVRGFAVRSPYRAYSLQPRRGDAGTGACTGSGGVTASSFRTLDLRARLARCGGFGHLRRNSSDKKINSPDRGAAGRGARRWVDKGVRGFQAATAIGPNRALRVCALTAISSATAFSTPMRTGAPSRETSMPVRRSRRSMGVVVTVT